MDENEVFKKLDANVIGLNLMGKKPSFVCDRLSKMYTLGKEAKQNEKFSEAYIFFRRWIYCVNWLHKQNLDNKMITTYFSNDQIKEVKSLLQETIIKIKIQCAALNKPNHVSDGSKLKTNKGSNIGNDTDIPLQLPEIPNDEPQPKERDEITCVELFKILNQSDESNKKRVLIIDVRRTEEFSKCKISFPNLLIHIPAEKIITKKVSSYYITLLKEEDVEKFMRRSSDYTDIVVLVDSNSSIDSMDCNSPIALFKKCLEDYDNLAKYKRIAILKGGFQEWAVNYPNCVTISSTDQPSMKKDTLNDVTDASPFSFGKEFNRSSPILSESRIPGAKVRTLSTLKSQITNKSDQYSSMMCNEIPKVHEKSCYPSPLMNVNYYKPEDDTSDKQHFRTKSVRESKIVVNKLEKPIVDRSNKPGKKPANSAIGTTEKKLTSIQNSISEFKQKYDLANLDEWKREHLQTMQKEEQELIAELKQLKTSETKSNQLYPQLPKDALSLTLGTRKQTARLPNSYLNGEKENVQIQEVRQKVEKPKIEYRPVPQKMDVDENDIFKKSVKSEAAPVTPSLTRSYSSPHLAQLDIRKQVPEVDRSSKPTGLCENSNHNRHISVISSKDREQRMEPVYSSSGSHPGITGLKNLGNSCYMNSIIQCLSNTDHLASFFYNNTYVTCLKKDNEKSCTGYVAEEVAQVIKALWRGQYKSISPRDLKVVVGQYKLQFDSYEQQDSHEFLMFLLDWMHNDLKGTSKTSIRTPYDRPLTTAEKEWEKSMNGQSSIISDLFFGQLRSTIECLSCRKHSTTYETFNSLTMSLPVSNKCTLDDCVKKFVSGQNVSGWKCPNCKVPREGVKKFDIAKLPKIIVIHLNRFGETGGWLEKKNTAVEFPLKDFNLKMYLTQDGENLNNYNQTSSYNLYAMSNHYGTMEGGHYTAYCKSNGQNKWYKYDDHTVNEVPPSTVRNQSTSAYLLFYASASSESYINS